MPVFERLTKHEVEVRYGRRLDDTQWMVAACASRGTMTLDYNSSHAFLEVAIPRSKNDYTIYSFGKFATYFPGTALDHIFFFSTTEYATVGSPDENEFYTHRQLANFAFAVNPEEGFRLMDAIRRDIQLSRERNFVYQIESENCAKWVYEKLIEVLGAPRVPNLFVMPLLESEPSGAVGHVFRFIKNMPEAVHIPILTFLHKPLGAHKGVWVKENGIAVHKSLDKHEFWKTGHVYMPALLHQQKALEQIHGYIPSKDLVIANKKVAVQPQERHKNQWPPPPMVPG
jgi:hypothetical protein